MRNVNIWAKLFLGVTSVASLTGLLLSMFGVVSLDGLPWTLIVCWSIGTTIYFLVIDIQKKIRKRKLN